MGVHGLWRILQPVEETVRLPQLDSQTICIDLAIWMCHDMTVKYNSSVTLKLYVRNLFFRIVSLLQHGALPVGVCDGPAPALKLRAMQERQRKANPGSKVSNSTKRSHFRRIAKECCDLLELLGVPSLESPGEAESMCAFLNAKGWTDACLTADGDAFLYGATTVYSALSLAQGDACVSMFRSERIRTQLGLDRGHLIALALLLGCDFTTSARGVGPKRALEMLRGLSQEVDLLQALCDPGASEKLCPSDRNLVEKLVSKLPHASNWKEVIAEFLSNSEWTLPKRHFRWERPQPFRLISFCAKKLDWEEAYTLEKVLPLVASWDMLHPRLCLEPSLRPLRLLRRRQVKFVPSFEVEWTKFSFDNWTVEEHYTFCVPQHPFSSVHSQLVTAADEAKRKVAKKKSKKKEAKTEEGKGSEEGLVRQEGKSEDEGTPLPALIDRLAARLGAATISPAVCTCASAFRAGNWTPGQAELKLQLDSSLTVFSPTDSLHRKSNIPCVVHFEGCSAISVPYTASTCLSPVTPNPGIPFVLGKVESPLNCNAQDTNDSPVISKSIEVSLSPLPLDAGTPTAAPLPNAKLSLEASTPRGFVSDSAEEDSPLPLMERLARRWRL